MDRIANRLLAELTHRFAGAPVPSIRALHLPPAPWNGSKDGEFGAVELDDGSLGLSYVLLDDSLAAMAAGGTATRLAGADALAVARGWLGDDAVARTLGFAAVNALSRHLFDRAGFVPPAATDSIAGLDPRPGEHVGMVGYFPPLLRQVTAHGARLTVLELRADLAGEHPDCTVSLDPAVLRTCNKVLMTSTTLLNHSLDDLLAHCRQASRIALIGPGAGCLPGPLFDAGVTTLAGAWIADGEGFKQALAVGAPWGRCTRKFALQAADCPAALR